MRDHLELSVSIQAHSRLLEHSADELSRIGAANRVQNALHRALETLRLASPNYITSWMLWDDWTASNEIERPSARKSIGQRQKGGSEKVIHLADLIPRGSVKEGGSSKAGGSKFSTFGGMGGTGAKGTGKTL
jgi:hypothetical protein